MLEDVRLQAHVLMEIATFLGDSYDRPISLALTIQDMGGTEDTYFNVLAKTHYLILNTDISKYTLTDFKAFYQKLEPEVFRDVSDITIVKLLNALAIMHVEDLYPIAKNITLKYQLDNKIPGI